MMAKKQSRATKLAAEKRAAEEAAAWRAARARAQRRRTAIVAALVGLVLVIVVGAVLGVRSALSGPPPEEIPPAGADGYAVPAGQADAPVTVTIYEDFLCPFCGEFEDTSSGWLPEYVERGDVQVRYRVVAIVDRDGYSLRAASAYAAVLDDAGPEAAQSFHDLLFENQPEEGGDGLSDDQLVAYAEDAGAQAGPVADALAEETYAPWVKSATDAMGEDDVNATPTVLVDGELVDDYETVTELSEVLQSDVDARLQGQ